MHDVIELRPVGRETMNPRTIGNVVIDTLGKWVRFLKNHANAGAQCHRVLFFAVDVLAIQRDVTGYTRRLDRVVHAIETAQEGRLATTGRTDKRYDFLFADLKRHMLNRMIVTVVDVYVLSDHKRMIRTDVTDRLTRKLSPAFRDFRHCTLTSGGYHLRSILFRTMTAVRFI